MVTVLRNLVSQNHLPIKGEIVYKEIKNIVRLNFEYKYDQHYGEHINGNFEFFLDDYRDRLDFGINHLYFVDVNKKIENCLVHAEHLTHYPDVTRSITVEYEFRVVKVDS